MTATHAQSHAPAKEIFEGKSQESLDQAPMQLAASDAYRPGSQTAFRNDCHPGQNEHMGDDKLQTFLDNNLAPDELFRSCSDRTGGRSGSGHSDHTRSNDRGADTTLPRDRTEPGEHNGGYTRDDCHSPRDTHNPGDTTDVPGTRNPGSPTDRVSIEPCKDMPKPPLNPGEFLVVVINVSADQLDRAGDFIGRLLNSSFNRDSRGNGGADGGNGFHLGGIPSPGDVFGSLPGIGNLFGGRDGGRDGSGLPRPGDLLGGLPGIGELFGGGDDSQSGSGIPGPGDLLGNLPGMGGSGSGFPNPGDMLSGLPGLGSFGGNAGGGFMNPGSFFNDMPSPGDLFSSLPGPGDLFSSLPTPKDVVGGLPGLGGDSKIPMPHEIIEDAVTKPFKSLKNLFKRIF